MRPPLPSGFSLDQMARLSLFPADAVAVAEALGCPSLSYTYSEPTAFYEYTFDTCQAARERKLRNIVVSCGSIEDRPARDLYQLVDAAHVDLKGFDQDIYTKLNSGKLQPILNTLKTLQGAGRLVRDHQPRRADLHRRPRHHPPHVRLDRQGTGAGPAAALLALPSAAQAGLPHADARSRRW